MATTRNLDVEQYAAHLVEFAENNWQTFLAFSEDFDYTEADCEEGNAKLRKAAGQSV